MLRTKLPGLDLERRAIQFLRLGLTLLVIENQPQAPHGRQRAGMLRPEHSALDLKRNRHTIFPLRCNGAVAADWRPDYSSLPTQPDGRSQACADRFPAPLETLFLHPDICLRKKDRLPGAAWLSSSSCPGARTLASPRRAPRDSTSRLRGSALHYSGSGPTGTWNSRCRDARNQVRGGGYPASHGSTSPPPRSGFHLPVQWRDRSSISTCPGSWRRGYDAEFPRRDGGATRPLRIAPGSDIRCPSRPSSGPGVPGPSPVLCRCLSTLYPESRWPGCRCPAPRWGSTP